MKITFPKPGSLGEKPFAQAYQLQGLNNRQPSVLLISNGSRLPTFNAGDISITFGTDAVTLWLGAMNGGYQKTTLPFYIPIQTGTADPTTDNFPNDGNAGWYNRTDTTELWYCYNLGGALWGIAASTSF